MVAVCGGGGMWYVMVAVVAVVVCGSGMWYVVCGMW